YLENEKKSGVLSLLFEYSSQGSCPSICLEALQVSLRVNIVAELLELESVTDC
ncbi:HEAT repeat-containing protein 6-like, partial [Trifolium medium]|nr:HEAT repeat-containing protein 6-like [Trifolium medium]